MKICLVVAELFHADERRDGRTERRDKASSHFFFANLPTRLKRTPYVRPRPPACLLLISESKQFDRIFIKFGNGVLSKLVGQMQASLKMTQLK